MPTGYTAKLMEKGQTFREFAIECARAFGACITLRDSPDAPIPEEFKPDTYHVDAMTKAIRELRRFEEMTQQERETYGNERRNEAIKSHRKMLETAIAENERLTEMETAVRKWQPPTADHRGMKDFMLQQIDVSKHNLKFSREWLQDSEAKSPLDYFEEAVAQATRDIGYHEEQNAAEIERAQKRTDWVRQLRASLEGV